MIRLLAFALAVGLTLCSTFDAAAEQSPVLEEALTAAASGDDERVAALTAALPEGLAGRDLGHALLLKGQALLRLGRWREAEDALRGAAPLLPALADRIALARAEALLRDGRAEESAAQFAEARRRAALELVAMEADVGAVCSQLEAGAKNGVQRAAQLLLRYPTLPERPRVELEVAQLYERQGRAATAYARYRKLWLEEPETGAARRAGERLEELAKAGVRVAPARATEALARARALSADREFDRAEEELLAALQSASGSLRLGLQLELAIVAFRRGELARARGLLLDLQDRHGPVGPWLERVELQSGETATTIRRILDGRPPSRKTPTGKLVRVAEVHLDAGEYEQARAVLAYAKMSQSPGFFAHWLPWIALKTGDPDGAIPGLSRLGEESWSRGRRAYWVGRAHQKAGRPCEARASFEQAIDQAPHGYYGLWARKRLGQLGEEVAASLAQQGAPPLACPAPTAEAPEATAPWTAPDPLAGWRLGPRRQARPTRSEGLEALEELIVRHGEALPWLERARELWLSGDEIGAGEELHQTLLASRGSLAPKVGLSQLWGGRARVARPGKARPTRLAADELELFLRAVEALGEPGLSLRADRPPWSDQESWHPLAFEERVRATAARYGLAPELIWSIMRIESYFNRHAISHAQALGLMQILPRTGNRIARRLAAEGFEVSDLLSPRSGLEFSGWYLRALADRFHDQTPLMIAAYNGGPHNVASWISRRSDRERPLPMDEFLEEIPFDETYRYVRRVLGSQAVYHALAGLPPPELPDEVDRDVAGGVNF